MSANRVADFYPALGHAVRVLRTDLGLSRLELAERAGISYSYVSAIENGTRPPSSKVQLAIAEGLGVKVHELLAAAQAKIEGPATPRRMAQANPSAVPPAPTEYGALTELRQLLPRMSPHDVDRVLDLARRFAD